MYESVVPTVDLNKCGSEVVDDIVYVSAGYVFCLNGHLCISSHQPDTRKCPPPLPPSRPCIGDSRQAGGGLACTSFFTHVQPSTVCISNEPPARPPPRSEYNSPQGAFLDLLHWHNVSLQWTVAVTHIVTSVRHDISDMTRPVLGFMHVKLISRPFYYITGKSAL